MVNRFGMEIRRGDLVSFYTSRGEIRTGFVLKFFRISGYGWRIETGSASCGVDDVAKVTRIFMRKGCQIEVGTGKPGYRWVQGWQVLNPETGAWSAEMRRRDAMNSVYWMKKEAGL